MSCHVSDRIAAPCQSGADTHAHGGTVHMITEILKRDGRGVAVETSTKFYCADHCPCCHPTLTPWGNAEPRTIAGSQEKLY